MPFYRVFLLNSNLTSTHEHIQAQKAETNDNTEFSQPYPIVALLETGTAIF
jgi:hypothetical protein